MRLIVTVVALLGALAAPVLAQTFDDPRELVAWVYAPYLKGEVPEDYPKNQFTPTLRQLWDDMEQRSEAADMPILDFDPFINGQDFELAEFAVADPLVEGDTATVVATFLNFEAPQEMRFTLERRADGWKIDDLESVSDDYSYRLSEILADDPLLN